MDADLTTIILYIGVFAVAIGSLAQRIGPSSFGYCGSGFKRWKTVWKTGCPDRETHSVSEKSDFGPDYN
ncbi:hypothetical protein N7455_008190 [Penicillium solitum]|uniref:uncharacterized protein n=1 Tax=Penicillium solitum TaxID=60172 RepID=UPI0032C3DAF7|nr:hypothetical protein N7536_011860 [Penicillium majusculum]KAJ5857296.1 hypothetical protein N7455_008190 [Penicillium solitum]